MRNLAQARTVSSVISLVVGTAASVTVAVSLCALGGWCTPAAEPTDGPPTAAVRSADGGFGPLPGSVTDSVLAPPELREGRDGRSPAERLVAPEGASFSPALQLDDASVQLLELNDDEAPAYARFRFAETVHRITDEEGFVVRDGSGRVVARSVDATLDQQRRRAVVVRFPPGTDLAEFPVASVDPAVVVDRAGKANPISSTQLGDQPSGPTVAPELSEATTSLGPNWITFTFTSNLAHDRPADRTDFGFYDNDGLLHIGADIVAAVDDRIVVRFDKAAGSNVADAGRAVVFADAVHDRQGHGNTLGVLGAPTAASDLVDARRMSNTVVRYEFDGIVTAVEPSRFGARMANGDRYEGTFHAISEQSRTVDVVFPDLLDVSNPLTVATVQPGAADGATPIELMPTAGAVELASFADQHGLTAAPNLQQVEIDERTGFVTLTFDQELDHRKANSFRPSAIALISDAGNPTTGELIVDVIDDRLVVAFAQAAARDARAVSVAAGAVVDHQGTPNLPATLRP